MRHHITSYAGSHAMGWMAQDKVGVLLMDLAELKAALEPSPTALLDKLWHVLPRTASEMYEAFSSQVHGAISALSRTCTCAEEYVDKLSFLETLRAREGALEDVFGELRALYDLIFEQGMAVSSLEQASFATAIPDWSHLHSVLDDVESAHQEKVAKFNGELVEGLERVRESCRDTLAAVHAEMVLNEASDSDEVMAYLQKHIQTLSSLQGASSFIASQQKAFGLPETKDEELKSALHEVELRLQLWQADRDWEEAVRTWNAVPFSTLNVAALEDRINGFHRLIPMLQAELPPNQVVANLGNKIQVLRDALPLVAALRNPALKERHWLKAQTLAGPTLNRTDNTSLLSVLSPQMVAAKEAIISVSVEASQEGTLEDALARVSLRWATIDLPVVPYKDSKDVFVLGPLDELTAPLEDSMVTVSTILSSRYVTGIRAEVERVERQLQNLSVTLEEWMACQRSWMWLESIFGAPDIQRQLPHEAKSFANVDRHFRELMKRANDRPNAIQAASSPGLLEMLKRNNEILERVGKNLEDYLETKRMAFPRFYFLSNDELQEILSQGKAPQAVHSHISKCFDNIRRLEFGDEAHSTDILGMYSGEGEYVAFSKPVKARGSVDAWMFSVEAAMVSSLRKLARSAFQSHPTMEQADWLHQQPAQIALLVSQMYMAAAVERCMASKDPTRPLSPMPGNAGDSCLASRACLIKQRVHSPAQFEMADAAAVCLARRWRRHCHPPGPAGTGKTETIKDLSRALGMNCVVFNSGESLDFRFMGRFFAGLAQSGAWACFDEFNRIDIEVLSVVADAAPHSAECSQGQPTQQPIDIYRALLADLLHLQCSLVRSCRRFLKDRLRKLLPLLILFVGEQAELQKFTFEGRMIKLVPTVGVFITLNPGYIGRTELPDNLKALFRPVAMTVPDTCLVAEVLLFAEGFDAPKQLAVKLVRAYRLASEQLSRHDHYDWGMRAVRCVLTMAGSIRRAAAGLSDADAVLRALHDSTVPKLVGDDIQLFLAILSDLFPNMSIPDQQRDRLLEAAALDLQERGLQAPQPLLDKVVQLHEMLQARFGVMFIGPAGGGKSTAIRTLQMRRSGPDVVFGKAGRFGTLERDGSQSGGQHTGSAVLRLQPQVRGYGELYGEYHPLTNEWQDGLASALIRAAVADSSPSHKWLIFDGPVDPTWIENLNTVLDDNCTLCLPNGERIKLKPDGMRLIFEVPDVEMASPATISRCGMVYVPADQLGWRPLVLTWLSQSLPDMASAAVRDLLLERFERTMDKGLAFLQQQGPQPIQCIENQIVTTLCKFVQVFLESGKLDFSGSELQWQRALSLVYVFAFTWAFGGNLLRSAHTAFDKFARGVFDDVSHDLPLNGSLFNCYVEVSPDGNAEFRTWSDQILLGQSQPINSVTLPALVPTAHTKCYSFLMEMMLQAKRPMIFTGTTGVGKTAIITHGLAALQNSNGVAPYTINFSAQTRARDTQLFMESKLEMKRKTRLGAPANRHVVFFVDDINMPAQEKYGAQPPIELLRQLQDYKGFYDRKKLFWKEVEGTTLVGACGMPGGGRQPMSQRFTRHFTLISIPAPSDSSVSTILSTTVTGDAPFTLGYLHKTPLQMYV
eukprot:jgi/Botrbrau1/7695/Bobra.0159s0133.1